ncbi:MAG: NUDIX domain-containing protein [Granulosicoccus sp.]
MQRRKLVDNKWVTFLEDKFSLPNGAECTYYHAQKSDAVMATVIEGNSPNGYTYIVNQHRHPIEQSIWQFPIGGFDSRTEDPIESAKRELLEETGVKAGGMDYLGSFYADPGFTNQKIHVCASNDVLEVGEQQLENSEQGLICERVKISSVGSLIDSGEMGDGWGLAGHYYLHKYLSTI